MQIKISARHGHLNEEVQQFIRDKADKLPHLFERLTMIDITVDLRGDEKHVEFVVQAEHKHQFVAHDQDANLLAAVDLVMAKIEGQLRRYKEKIQDRRRTPSAGEVNSSPHEEEATDE